LDFYFLAGSNWDWENGVRARRCESIGCEWFWKVELDWASWHVKRSGEAWAVVAMQYYHGGIASACGGVRAERIESVDVINP
jgi:hypothetical protein